MTETTTVRERLLAAGLTPEHVNDHLAAGRVELPDGTRVDGDTVIPVGVVPLIGMGPK